MSNYTVESTIVQTSDGAKLRTRLFKPMEEGEITDNLVVVLVHPFSILGGCQAFLQGIAAGLAGKGYKTVTFDMRGAGKSTGRPSLTGFAEIKDVIAVCKWVCENLSSDRILLVGSSAEYLFEWSSRGCMVEYANLKAHRLQVLQWMGIKEVIGYVSIGYPFGMFASILFGRHHKGILKSPKPKLFVMGTRDGFTSVKQLRKKLSSAAGRVETHLIEGTSHFQMEGAEFDNQMVNLILTFISSL
ncbi:ALPHA/BETA HYDROLASE DOMAIN-CONTAINING PROTEIN [Salix purpurea]|uniref:ALPHA/BETA HYDROLASE DOMAIN-CONTAINING PROTEIN n=1 Tax=Salix purpurea TaxID=77065 RepID=A0A9Q0T8S9_SALPP|nr:ALPHA/BETA HYDROLASE DOMAIN-CONTAINING PROTEIN [Salix purpurea]